ncbi:hypothetical protein [Mesorhizobium sp. KR9-304]|uniref:hypothetical protein n=1 Tax=Mesorhizobium sp. KR9-304 TaxID=3156614 RepID=UPI0032B3239F
MADGSRPRAVSGEIMTDPPADAPDRPAREGAGAGDVIEAEYISLPPERPPSEPQRAESDAHEAPVSIGSAAPPLGGMEMLRRKAAAAPPQKVARGGPLFWTLGIGLAAAAFWVSGGHVLVRNASIIGIETPRSALRISGVTSRVDASGARPVLFIDGEAANDGTATEHLPPLDIAVAGNDGLVTYYRLGTAGRPMAPGETFAFSSRLDVPKNGVKTVSVTFAE